PTAALFWGKDGELYTPALEVGILDSITRRELLATLPAHEDRFHIDSITGADEAFIASTVRGVQPVSRIADHELAHPGPFTVRARQALSQAVERELAQ
ncbi:MAG: aminotransferase class IV, partial [bacterium]|nr:aminotransferase class IV [bacterium]